MFYSKPHYVLFIHMVINDMLHLILTVFLLTITYVLYFLPASMCTIFTLVIISSTENTPLNLACMTLECYIAICHPLHHAKICTLKRTYMLIALMWLRLEMNVSGAGQSGGLETLQEAYPFIVTKNVIIVALGLAINYINGILIHTFRKHQGGGLENFQDVYAVKVTKIFIVVALGFGINFINGMLIHTFRKHQIFYTTPRYILFIHLVINDMIQLTTTVILYASHSQDYDVVKAAVLKAYELVPEAYRQRFRMCKKSGGQSYLEFTRDLKAHFSRWCAASKVTNFEKLGSLSPPGGGTVPIRILRDTGAYDSFVVGSVLPFSAETATGDFILSRGMGMTVLPIPLHRMKLECELVRGEVTVGVRPALPIEGIHFILGNGLAGGRVWADTDTGGGETVDADAVELPAAPVVTLCPMAPESGSSSQPDVFPACAVTRAMHKVASASSAASSDFVLSMAEFPLNVSRAELVRAQRDDLTLEKHQRGNLEQGVVSWVVCVVLR
uniref:G-protein coupled receptors family 1 profile domain-containing protein n=1 Tax=Knipowitschia caucasica TaxID=637954 RepID=A0AAV2M874_KNICA